MADKFEGFESLTSQSERWAAIVPDDAAILAVTPKALYFNTAGTVTIVGDDGVGSPFNVAAGQTLQCRPLKVMATGTTLLAANDIIALL